MNDREKRQETIKAVLHHFFQDNTHSGPHSRFNLKYHLVWITKYRRKFIVGKLASRLRQILSEVARNYGFKIIALEVMPDHIHLLIESPPKYSPSKIAQIFKGISSRRMRQEFLEVIRHHIWKEGVLWARGYYIASVGDNITSEIVAEYIRNQRALKEGEQKTAPSELKQLSLI